MAPTAFRSFSCKNWSKACSAKRSSLSIFWRIISSFRNSSSNRFFSSCFTDKEYCNLKKKYNNNFFRQKPYIFYNFLKVSTSTKYLLICSYCSANLHQTYYSQLSTESTQGTQGFRKVLKNFRRIKNLYWNLF